MYEERTYERILGGMLEGVAAQNPNLDTREGSVIYNALAPAAAELAQLYIQLDVVLNETFADTASREYLIQRAAERGITPYPATKAVLKGEFNMDVPIGSRFSLDKLNYAAVEKVETGVFRMECETPGEVGNQQFGTLIPIDYIDGLETAMLTELLIPGEDEESTEALRERYFDSIGGEAFGGNVADYVQKTKAIEGVGGAKVFPVWNGGGTVKVVITASDDTVPTQELVTKVQTALDPTQNAGQGLGIAPIGHVVTVQGATYTTVNVATAITCQEGYSFEDIKQSAEDVIKEYFLELSGQWDQNEALIVRVSQIETRLLDLVGILDIENTKLNGGSGNLTLDSSSLPKLGALTNG